jgi:hypothetical protein
MAKRKPSGTGKIYQLKVTLAGIRPPIWRRLQVPADTRLDHLHLMVQAGMGWHNCHLHAFKIDDIDYGEPDPNWGDLEIEDETSVRLDEAAREEGMQFLYTYDFGDGWEHIIRVEKILAPDPDVKYPVCRAGKRACPPEDCGGIWGYEEFLEAIRDPDHEEHERMLEWIGGSFDPDAFDLAETNASLKNYKKFDIRNL